jgi:ribosomal protein S8
VVEQWIENPCVSGSIPLLNTSTVDISLINAISSLKNIQTANKGFIVTKNTKMIKKVLKLLYKEKLIRAYESIGAYIKVYVNLDNSINLINAKIFSSGSKEKHVSYLELCKMSLKHKVIVVSTPFGLLTSFECKKVKSGGKLFFFA